MSGARPLTPDSPFTDAGQLRSDLAELAITCEVEGRGLMAVLVTERGAYAATLARLEEPGARESVVRAARARGFTHVALELREEEG